MSATNTGYAGVRSTSGTKVGASGKRVNLPVTAGTRPRRRYPSWSLQAVVQSGLWYQMKNRPWSAAMAHTIHSDRRGSIVEILIQQLCVELLDVVDESIESVPGRDRSPAVLAH